MLEALERVTYLVQPIENSSRTCLRCNSVSGSSVSIMVWTSERPSSLKSEQVKTATISHGASHQFIRNFSDDIGIVHSPAIIWPNRSDMHARFIIPVGKKVVEFIMSHWPHWYCCALPGTTIRSNSFCINKNFMKLTEVDWMLLHTQLVTIRIVQILR